MGLGVYVTFQMYVVVCKKKVNNLAISAHMFHIL